MQNPSDSTPQPCQTREKLLEAAAKLFSEQGFEAVSIREIASLAGVRHGGVNYHFKSKRELYMEVVSRFGPRGNHAASGGNPELHAAFEIQNPLEAEVALRNMVRSHLAIMTEPPDPVSAGIIEQELKRPDGPDDQLFENVVLLRHRAMEHLLTILAPELTDPVELRLFSFGMTSQCLMYRLARPVAYRLMELDTQSTMDEDRIDRIANLIVNTTLRGILAQPETQPEAQPKPLTQDRS